ncbi:MAG: helix-turn-helix transcriptional regulator, partial [Eubacteriales bacterium]|nr:helix-turn-helix transcriptional regulator [Eubacteriales bacterium]
EKNLSQKQVSADLGISQALLSHYEKGIRECKLDFLIKTAEYYNVSCDFLLGRTPERSGATLSFEDIPDGEDNDTNPKNSGLVTQLNKKILCNCLAVIFDMLARARSNQLTADVSNYLMLAVYRVFRTLYSANPENHQSMFAVDEGLYEGYCEGHMELFATKFRHLAKESTTSASALRIRREKYSAELLSQEYPDQSSSLFNLIQHAESKIKKRN